MLKNKNQRKEYLENNENWDLVDSMEIGGEEIFREFKLKDVNIYKIQVHHDKNKYFKERWESYGYWGLFTLSENGLFKSNLNTTEALDIIRHTEANQ